MKNKTIIMNKNKIRKITNKIVKIKFPGILNILNNIFKYDKYNLLFNNYICLNKLFGNKLILEENINYFLAIKISLFLIFNIGNKFELELNKVLSTVIQNIKFKDFHFDINNEIDLSCFLDNKQLNIINIYAKKIMLIFLNINIKNEYISQYSYYLFILAVLKIVDKQESKDIYFIEKLKINKNINKNISFINTELYNEFIIMNNRINKKG